MDYFPLNVASGKSFCNRKVELDYICNNINKIKPTLITSPRRYGKTSMALQAIHRIGSPFAKFDFLSAVEAIDIESIILSGISDLILKLSKGPKKAFELAQALFSDLDFKISIEKFGISMELTNKDHKPAYQILKMLKRIEQFAIEKNHNIVLFFDEFQHVYQIVEDTSIESILREIAQSSKSLMFIFSGSNRHLLQLMFDDSNRPFYKLCDKIIVNRIESKHYIPYIQHAAKERWNKELKDNTLDKIFEYTERHPYYINLLCSRLWQLSTPPVENDVERVWSQYIQEERSQVAAELDLMSKNQRKLLIKIARIGQVIEPSGMAFQQKANMPNTSISQALMFLQKRDYIFKNEEGVYCVLDPLIKAVIQ